MSLLVLCVTKVSVCSAPLHSKTRASLPSQLRCRVRQPLPPPRNPAWIADSHPISWCAVMWLRWQTVVDLHLSMQEEAGLRPSVSSYNVVVESLAKAGEWQRALSMLEEMKRGGIRPTEYTYNRCMAGEGFLVQRHLVDLALKLSALAKSGECGVGRRRRVACSNHPGSILSLMFR